jgi:hypothetical protein
VGSFTHRDSAGAVSFHFTGRVRGRKLEPGGYRLLAARLSGQAGDTTRIAFRIIG